MDTHLVFITFNRVEYTRLALASVLADPTERFALTIWDNASTDGTVEYLKNEVSDPRIADIVFSKENVGQTAAVNRIWSQSKADLLGKLDNDCIMTPGWTRTLAKAHEDIDSLGVVACWHFFPQDFVYERAKHKIHEFNGHHIFRHPSTCGTGFLIKRKVFERLGPMQSKTTTDYWMRMAACGYINGFYYPLVLQEHMDDPRSEHCRLRHMAFDKAYEYTYGYQTGVLKDLRGYNELHRGILDDLLDNPYDPRYHFGRFARIWRLARRIGKSVGFVR